LHLLQWLTCRRRVVCIWNCTHLAKESRHTVEFPPHPANPVLTYRGFGSLPFQKSLDLTRPRRGLGGSESLDLGRPLEVLQYALAPGCNRHNRMPRTLESALNAAWALDYRSAPVWVQVSLHLRRRLPPVFTKSVSSPAQRLGVIALTTTLSEPDARKWIQPSRIVSSPNLGRGHSMHERIRAHLGRPRRAPREEDHVLLQQSPTGRGRVLSLPFPRQ
jgi:hypothetical protein